MRTKPFLSTSIAQRVIGILIAGACVLLSGCGPSVTCTQNVDGGRLLKSISEANTPVDALAEAAIQLISACKLTPEQQAGIDKVVERVATEGSADIQASFYSKLSAASPNAPERIGFIKKSTLIAGTAKSAQSKLSLVDFEHLGAPYDLASATPQVSSALKTAGLDKAEASDIRLVKSDVGDLLLVRSSANAGFAETIRISVFDIAQAGKVSMPIEELDVVSVRSDDKTLLEYFFDCASFAGGICTVRDSRFAIDESGKVKYVASVTVNDAENDECGLSLTVLQPGKGSFKKLNELAHEDRISCSQAPTIDQHGDPFATYSEKDVQDRLATLGGYPNLAQLVNIQRKDAADTAVKEALWGQGLRWKTGLIEAAVSPLDLPKIKEAKSAEDASKILEAQINVVSSNLANLKWLVSNPHPDATLGIKISSTESKLQGIRKRLSELKGPDLPKPLEPLDYPVEQVSIAIQREIQSSDQGLVRFADTPYMYFGARLPDSQLVVLYSQRQLIDRPGLVRVIASRGNEADKLMVGGFTRNVWMYKTLSDKEMAEYQEHYKKQEEYNRQVSAFKTFQKQSVATVNQIIRDVEMADLGVKSIAKDAPY